MFRNPASYFLRIPIETSPIAWTRHTPPLLVSPHAHLSPVCPPRFIIIPYHTVILQFFSPQPLFPTLYTYSLSYPILHIISINFVATNVATNEVLSVLTYSPAKASWILECMNPGLSGTKCYISVIKRTSSCNRSS